MQQILLIFHMVFAIALVALVLVQQGKGAGMGVSLGAGASQTVFGSRGAGGFLLKLTCGLAALFFATSLTLSYMSNHWAKQQHNNSVSGQLAALSQTMHKSIVVDNRPQAKQSGQPSGNIVDNNQPQQKVVSQQAKQSEQLGQSSGNVVENSQLQQKAANQSQVATVVKNSK